MLAIIPVASGQVSLHTSVTAEVIHQSDDSVILRRFEAIRQFTTYMFSALLTLLLYGWSFPKDVKGIVPRKENVDKEYHLKVIFV